jgi:DNA-binding MarR family transcriptional regulator
MAPHNLPYQLFLLVQQLNRRFQQVLDPYDLTPLHWGVLCCLWSEDGIRPTEIAQTLEQFAGQITLGLDALLSRGLIERRTEAADRRVSRVFLTQAGSDLKAVLVPQVESLIGDIFSVFSEAEYAQFSENVGKLRRHLLPNPALER